MARNRDGLNSNKPQLRAAHVSASSAGVGGCAANIASVLRIYGVHTHARASHHQALAVTLFGEGVEGWQSPSLQR